MVGTAEHARVRDSIIAFCNGFQLETRVDTGVGIRRIGGIVSGARSLNILARLKGSQQGKAVYVVAHYDTQPNTPGAGDDGAAVVAMMECIRALKADGKTLRNDVVFLFTDAEELGLLGATALTTNAATDSVKQNMGIVLNFDGTAVRGANMLIGSSAGNRELIGHYLQVPHPLGTSLSAAIKRIAPGDVDFTVFNNAGIPGLSMVTAEGRSHYHSLVDRYEWYDLRTLQQTGDNMLSLVRSFGNDDPAKLQGPQITYFNLFGKNMVVYPASWNGPILLVANLLFIFSLFAFVRRERAGERNVWLEWTGGILRYLVVLLIAGVLSFSLILAIRYAYPQNSNFYGAEAYNAWLYYIALFSVGAAVFGLVYASGRGKLTLPSLMMGFHTVVLALVNVLYFYVPEAIYFLLFPLIFSMLAQIIPWTRYSDGQPGWVEAVFQFFGAMPACLLLPILLYFSYAGTFGLSTMTAYTGIYGLLLLGFMLPLWRAADNLLPGWLASIALMSIFTCLVMAHISSRFTGRHPLRSSLYYRFDADEKKAVWISDFPLTNRWNKIYLGPLATPKSNDPTTYYPGQPAEGQLTNPALPIDYPLPEVVVLKDSVIGSRRHLQLAAFSGRAAPSLRLIFDPKSIPEDLRLNGRPVPADLSRMIFFAGLGTDSLKIECRLPYGKTLQIQVIDCSVGLPPEAETVIRPDDIIPAAGYNDNTTQIIRRYQF
ncbi:peptidase M28 family protein [Flavihumibacter petaseus NBRC 106054]|uniref:Vacuolar membrane protease n=2 Tax=Flavihumibacter TaxID=1004301 RepID=A0A0E9MXQ0_9BACT|nr:peptidase M28 family protein [Flavihumibacter petaseus NBRC 106054]